MTTLTTGYVDNFSRDLLWIFCLLVRFAAPESAILVRKPSSTIIPVLHMSFLDLDVKR